MHQQTVFHSTLLHPTSTEEIKKFPHTSVSEAHVVFSFSTTATNYFPAISSTKVSTRLRLAQSIASTSWALVTRKLPLRPGSVSGKPAHNASFTQKRTVRLRNQVLGFQPQVAPRYWESCCRPKLSLPYPGWVGPGSYHWACGQKLKGILHKMSSVSFTQQKPTVRLINQARVFFWVAASICYPHSYKWHNCPF